MGLAVHTPSMELFFHNFSDRHVKRVCNPLQNFSATFSVPGMLTTQPVHPLWNCSVTVCMQGTLTGTRRTHIL